MRGMECPRVRQWEHCRQPGRDDALRQRASVLKLEPPVGDRRRQEIPSGFLVWNRGKESLVADLGTPEGRHVVRAAAEHADVLLAGVPSGLLEKWGLGESHLQTANQGLVPCQINGFGPIGEYSHLRPYEGVVAAKVGVFARGDFSFRAGPIFYDAPWASLGAAHHAFSGILAALMVREATGRGQHLDATLANGISSLDYFGTMHRKAARARGEAPLVTISTKAPSIAATRNALWAAIKDSRFVELVSALGELLTPHRAADLEATLTAAGVGCAVASEAGRSAFASTDAVLFATGLTVDVDGDHPLFGPIRRHSPPSRSARRRYGWLRVACGGSTTATSCWASDTPLARSTISSDRSSYSGPTCGRTSIGLDPGRTRP